MLIKLFDSSLREGTQSADAAFLQQAGVEQLFITPKQTQTFSGRDNESHRESKDPVAFSCASYPLTWVSRFSLVLCLIPQTNRTLVVISWTRNSKIIISNLHLFNI